ncbi:MAG: potassium transporter [Gammaproteobacteria bacterium]|nr:MAG: potassium transporter [Gammaproteobacteria bacterium]
MRISTIQQVLGLLLMLFSLAMLPASAIALFSRDQTLGPFLLSFGLILGIGLLLWWPVRRARLDLRLRDGFAIVALFWIGLGLTGALPLMLSPRPHMPLAAAVFESVSALTTTGATVLTVIDGLPASILFYRAQLQWMGGMGIIVLAVAVLPMLGIGGMQLYRAETPGPMKDTKLTPRLAETAKALWRIYLLLTLACILAYWAGGMGLFDAICHAFTTVSTGGMSNHEASFAWFDSPLLESIAVLFMFLGGVNFSLHFLALRGGGIGTYRRDAEFRAYLGFYVLVFLLVAFYLTVLHAYEPLLALRESLFQVVSVGTSTGFTTANFAEWPGFAPVLLIFISFVGGCAGSTAGGMKMIRVLLLYLQGKREVLRLIHPNAVLPVKLGGEAVPGRIVESVWGFFAAYVATFAVAMLALMALGEDQVTAFSAVAACINNLGPGLGQVSTDFQAIPDPGKWLLALTMIMGRLEIFTLLVLISPAYWRS